MSHVIMIAIGSFAAGFTLSGGVIFEKWFLYVLSAANAAMVGVHFWLSA